MDRDSKILPRSEASRAQLRSAARRSKPEASPSRCEAGGLRFENYKQLVLGTDDAPFEGRTLVVYVSMEEPRHLFNDVRAVARFALPAFGGIVIARFYPYAHPRCPKKKRGNGAVCPNPDPAPTGAVVVEMERILGRQIPAREPLRPEDVARILSSAGPLLGQVATVARDRFGSALESPYSKIARIDPLEASKKHAENPSGRGKPTVTVPGEGEGEGTVSSREKLTLPFSKPVSLSRFRVRELRPKGAA